MKWLDKYFELFAAVFFIVIIVIMLIAFLSTDFNFYKTKFQIRDEIIQECLQTERYTVEQCILILKND